MIKLKKNYLTVILGLFVSIVAGCLPEDKVDWSDDGLVGVAKIADKLYLIDGKDNTAKIIDAGELQVGPFISADGKMIAYAKNEYFKNADKLSELLPEDRVSVIRQYVRGVHDLIVREGSFNKDKIEKEELFPRMQSGQFAGLVYSLIALQADQALLEVLKPDELKLVEEVKKQGFKLCHLYVVKLNGLETGEKRVAHISCFSMVSPRISPDGKSIAYLMLDDFRDDDKTTYNLYGATLDGRMGAAQVAADVAVGYSWSGDGRKLAFIVNESPGQKREDFMWGSLAERVIVDEQGQLQASPAADRQQYNSMATHYGEGPKAELAGVIFYPGTGVSYHPSGRIFFSSTPMQLPASKLHEEKMSVFCYDPLLKTVTDVLPRGISAPLSMSVFNFEISPNGEKLLLPLQQQRFMIYTLGQGQAISPLDEPNAFGEKEVFKMVPAWKGNNQISCLVKKDCPFLKGVSADFMKDQAVAIIDSRGQFIDVLKLKPAE